MDNVFKMERDLKLNILNEIEMNETEKWEQIKYLTYL